MQQTTRSLDERVREHIGYIRNLQMNQPTGNRYNLPGNKLYHLKASAGILGEVYLKYKNLKTSEIL